MQLKHTTFQIFKSYIPWMITSIILGLFLRIIEVAEMLNNHIVNHLFRSELLGGLFDVFLIGTLNVCLFIFYFFITKFSFKVANIFIGTILSLFSILHIGFLFYFFQMFIPLDASLFEYSLQEIVFTVRTSNSNYLLFFVLSLLSVFIIIFFYKIFKKIKISFFITIAGFAFLFFSLIFTFFISNNTRLNNRTNLNYNIIVNKSYYFYHSAFIYRTYSKNTDNNIPEIQHKNVLFPEKEFVSKEYPLLSKTDFRDVLSPFFKKNDSLPNIVFILVEGLGNRFIENYLNVEFMPFLNDLASKSLYWNNVISASDRSYGAIPSILASTPHAEKGFTFTNNDLYHLSLLNILSKYNYYSTFFYGQPSWFDQAKDFFNRNGVNRIEHAYTYPEKYKKIIVDDYFWGYDDKDLVRRTLEVIDGLPSSPRVDFIYTGSMHSPFIISEKEKYNARINAALQTLSSKKDKEFIKKYKDYFATIFFTDDALKMLIDGYKQRPGFENTIFIITGDHNMNNIPPENELDIFHVPLIVYSSMIEQPKLFHSINSHLDIVPTLLAFLNNRNGIKIPDENAFIGKILDTSTHFRSLQPVVCMSQRVISDILYNDYYFSQNGNLYKIDEKFNTQTVKNDSIQSLLDTLMTDFTLLDHYACNKNKLITEQLYYQYADITMLVPPFKHTYHINEQTEFSNIIHQEPLTKKGIYYFDFFVPQYTTSQTNIPSLVMEVKNMKTNESILWESCNITEKDGKIHFLFLIDSTDFSDDLLFSAYFWNEKKGTLDIPFANSSLYRLGK